MKSRANQTWGTRGGMPVGKSPKDYPKNFPCPNCHVGPARRCTKVNSMGMIVSRTNFCKERVLHAKGLIPLNDDWYTGPK